MVAKMNRLPITLLVQKYNFAEYVAECPHCNIMHFFSTWKMDGCAEMVNVICENCGNVIGRVRHDMGTDIRCYKGVTA